jgi:threonine/homoserine/homoserine lactone efflux protein
VAHWQVVIETLAPFVAVSALVIVAPGPDTALTIRNTLVGGRRSGLGTALGVVAGQSVWVLATSAGLAALLAAWHPAFVAVRLAGAAYLVFLGVQAVRAAVFSSAPPAEAAGRSPGRRLRPSRALGQGMLSNLGNPKMAVFFTSLLPQFAPAGGGFASLLRLGAIFCGMTLVWLSLYVLVVSRAGEVIRRQRVWRTLEGITGTVMIGLGVRVATEPA